MKFICFCTLLLLLVIPATLPAVEGGLGLFPLGFPTNKFGYQPPPGSAVLRVDFQHYTARLKGLARLKTDICYLGYRYVTDYKILGGDYAFGGFIPFGKVSTHVNGVRVDKSFIQTPSPSGIPLPTVVLTAKKTTKHGSAHGIADCSFAPIILGWHYDNFHTTFIQGVYIPTGKYSKHKVANMGFHRWATETDLACTWLNINTGTEISVLTGLTVNFTNHKTHYHSGNEWHTNFYLGQYVTTSLEVALAGYWYEQLTPDQGKGAVLGNFRGKVFGWGPCINYDFTTGNVKWNACARYFKECHAHNHFKGHQIWFTIYTLF